jgi:hypothetical protein
MAFAGQPSEAHERRVTGLIDTGDKRREGYLSVLVQIMPDISRDNADFCYHDASFEFIVVREEGDVNIF